MALLPVISILLIVIAKEFVAMNKMKINEALRSILFIVI